MAILADVWQVLASDKIWLPGNLTWEDVDAMPHYPRAGDLSYAFVIAAVLLILRFGLDRFLLLPLTRTLKVFRQQSKLEQNPILEKAFMQNSFDKRHIQQLSHELKCTVHQIEIWLKRKKHIVSKQRKFMESVWRLLFYSIAFVYGCFVTWGKPCATDIAACYPESTKNAVLTELARWYYLVELGFYLSLCASLLYDARRKDFKIMIAHHAFTILLITVSWVVNAANVGCLVLLCHDVGDVPLEASKLSVYLKKTKLSTVLFALFFVVWCVSRLMYYPFIIHGTIVYGTLHYSTFCYYSFCTLLSLLFCLHILWTKMIVQILIINLTKNKLEDVRSDSESGFSDEEDSKTK